MINDKRIDFDGKSHKLKYEIIREAWKLWLTNFDLECILSEMISRSINKRLDKKYWKYNI